MGRLSHFASEPTSVSVLPPLRRIHSRLTLSRTITGSGRFTLSVNLPSRLTEPSFNHRPAIHDTTFGRRMCSCKEYCHDDVARRQIRRRHRPRPRGGGVFVQQRPDPAGPAAFGAGAATPGSAQDFVVNVGDRVFFETDQTDLTADRDRHPRQAGPVAVALSELHLPDRRPCGRARHPRIQLLAQRPPGPERPRLPRVARASRPRASASSPTARSVRSRSATTSPAGRRTAARSPFSTQAPARKRRGAKSVLVAGSRPVPAKAASSGISHNVAAAALMCYRHAAP